MPILSATLRHRPKAGKSHKFSDDVTAMSRDWPFPVADLPPCHAADTDPVQCCHLVNAREAESYLQHCARPVAFHRLCKCADVWQFLWDVLAVRASAEMWHLEEHYFLPVVTEYFSSNTCSQEIRPRPYWNILCCLSWTNVDLLSRWSMACSNTFHARRESPRGRRQPEAKYGMGWGV